VINMRADQTLIQNAVDLATKAHSGAFRKSGSVQLPYIAHPLHVARLLWSWGLDDINVILAAICHDVLEDTAVTTEELRDVIGDEVAEIVNELTCLPSVSKEDYMNSFESKSIRAFSIKIADRICNTEDFLCFDPPYALKYWKKAKALINLQPKRAKEISEVLGFGFSSHMGTEIGLTIFNLNGFNCPGISDF
jgi:(p)ppGpp synthase/HD superfamily hydrolase